MITPPTTGISSRKRSDAPSSDAVRNPFCPARRFQAVNGDASASAIAGGRRTIRYTTTTTPRSVATSQVRKALA